jgi:V/A-type H+/Na+-transporting ATPase subunit K
MDFAMMGPALVLGLACIGSAIGCGIGGMATVAVMSRVEENHGKFIGMAAMAATQSILGFVLMVLMRDAIRNGGLSPLSGVGIGVSVGFAFLATSLFIGKCAAAGVQAAAKQPGIIGKCFAILGLVESFSLFAFVFALLLI